MAEREGFEPSVPVKIHTLSRRAPSAARPSLPMNNDGRFNILFLFLCQVLKRILGMVF